MRLFVHGILKRLLCTNLNHKTGIIVILLIIFTMIVNLLMGVWFNHKINRVTQEIKNAMSSKPNEKITNISKNVNYGKLLKEQQNYSAKKQYFDYQSAMINQVKEVKLDERGIALKRQGEEYVYNPVIISQYGLNQYGNYIETGKKEYYEKAKLQADYLLEVQDKKNGNFYYNYDFQVAGTTETMKEPWTSAMAQGQVISLLSRIYFTSKQEKYIDAAELAMQPMTKKVSEGGLCADFFGYDYYEEYPTKIPSYTLNGFMFTLIGFHDLYEITQNKQAKELYDKGIETLKFCLPFYDNSNISLYHLGHLLGDNLPLHYAENYHRLHIIQLRTIDQFENDPTLKYYSNRWEDYVKENS